MCQKSYLSIAPKYYYNRIDDAAISGPTNPPRIEIATDIGDSVVQALGPQDSIVLYDGVKLLATIVNLSSHNYGNTSVYVENEGLGAVNFDTNTINQKRIFNKTLRIVPTTNNATGNYRITLYYDAQEAIAWKNATGRSLKDLTLIKSTGNISNGTYSNTIEGTQTVVDSTFMGNNLAVTCEFNNGFSGFGAGATASSGIGVLPVDLLSFTGKSQQGQNLLDWVTASELNTSHFEIQRMKNKSFEAIGNMSAAGNSNTIISYRFVDDKPLGSSNFYRLKMVDKDESFKYSKVIAINSPRPTDFRIYPTPAARNLYIEPELSNEHFTKICVFNSKGEKVKTIENATTAQKIDISQWVNGFYFVAIYEDNRLLTTKKIIVLN